MHPQLVRCPVLKSLTITVTSFPHSQRHTAVRSITVLLIGFPSLRIVSFPNFFPTSYFGFVLGSFIISLPDICGACFFPEASTASRYSLIEVAPQNRDRIPALTPADHRTVKDRPQDRLTVHYGSKPPDFLSVLIFSLCFHPP